MWDITSAPPSGYFPSSRRRNCSSNLQNIHSGSLNCEVRAVMVNKTQWKPLELPLSRKTVNQKQHFWEDCRVQCHHQGLEGCRGGHSYPFPIQFTAWLVQETDGSGRTTKGYHKLNPVVTPIAAAIPVVFSLFEQINTFLSTWYSAISLTIFFLHTFHKCHKKCVFSWQGQIFTLIFLPWGYVSSPALCHNQFAGIFIAFSF